MPRIPKRPRRSSGAPRGNDALQKKPRSREQAAKTMSVIDSLQPELRAIISEFGYGPVDNVLVDHYRTTLNSLSKSGTWLSKQQLGRVKQLAHDEMIKLHRDDMDPGSLFE